MEPGTPDRVTAAGGRSCVADYRRYAPRVLAGIAGLKETLEDRALPLFMFRKRRDEPVARLTGDSEGEAHYLREVCALACLGHMRPILTAYVEVPGQLEAAGIDDRAVDLWSPLLAVAKAADLEDAGNRTREVLAQARELSRLRDADAEAEQAVRAIEALDEIRTERGERLTPGELLEAFRARPGWQWVENPLRLAGLLNALGLWRQQVSDGPRRRWVYVLEPAELDELRSRYGDAETRIGVVKR
jgi:hypothetical protein